MRTRYTLLQIIHAAQPVSRVELARRLGIKRSRVSEIINPLLAAGVCRETSFEQVSGRLGRPPVGLTLCSERACFIGVSIGVSETHLRVVNVDGDKVMLWTKKDKEQHAIVHVKFSDHRWWLYQLAFFAAFYVTIFISLTYLKRSFAPGAIPWADAFASATAFTGMWLMTKKKVESWYWWIATNIASIPLYFVKQYVFTSVYYLVLLIMAVWGLMEWRKRAALK